MHLCSNQSSYNQWNIVIFYIIPLFQIVKSVCVHQSLPRLVESLPEGSDAKELYKNLLSSPMFAGNNKEVF